MHVATQIRFSESREGTPENENKSANAFATLVGNVMGGLSSIFSNDVSGSGGSEDDEVTISIELLLMIKDYERDSGSLVSAEESSEEDSGTGDKTEGRML